MQRTLRLSATAVVFFLAALALPAIGADDRAAGGIHSNNDALFSAEAYLAHIAYLASDELEGRGTGQVGIDKAADYITSVFEQCGVELAGDDGSYFQEFSLKLKSRIGDDTRLAIGTKGRNNRRRLRLGKDFTPFPFSGAGEFGGEVVFAGYGVVNDDLEYDDYDSLDVQDKVVLLLRSVPEFEDFGWRDAAFQAKAANAVEEGAAAILVVNPIGDEEGDTLFDFDSGSPGGFERPDYGIPMMHVTRRAANRMLKAAGLSDVAAIQKRIEDSRGPVSAPLEGVSVRGSVNIEPVDTPARNIVGLIPGAGDNADEIIVLGAHYDHLGIRHKGLPGFDPSQHISNGADDNASGTAMVLAMAEAYTQGARPNRSILLIAFTAEELGLFGSRHFVRHPTVDLEKCVAMLNFDMVGRLRNDRLDVYGLGSSPDFEGLVDRLAEPYGLEISGGTTFFGGSDHAPFYRAGMPVLFFFTGIHEQYHKAEDDTELINADGAMRIAKLAADCIDEIDTDDERPSFKEVKRKGRGGRRQRRRPAAVDSEPDARPDRVVLGVFVGSEEGVGVLVARVSDDSPASRAGIKSRDRIVGLGDKPIESTRDLVAALGRFKRGDGATVTVRRGEEVLKLDAVFGKPGKEAVQQAAAQQAVEQEANKQPAEEQDAIVRQIADTLNLFLPHLDDSAEVTVEIKGGLFKAVKLVMPARLWRESLDDMRLGKLPLPLDYALKLSRDKGRRPDAIVISAESHVREGIVEVGLKFELTFPIKSKSVERKDKTKAQPTPKPKPKQKKAA